MARQRDKRRDGVVITDLWRWKGRRGIGKRYLARVRDERLQAYKQRAFELEADAKAWAEEQRHLLALGESTAARFDIGPIGRDLLTTMEREKRSAQYVRQMRMAIAGLEKQGVGDLAADGFQAQVRAYLLSPTDENRRRGQDEAPAPRTIRIRFAYARALVRHAMREFRLKADPLADFRMPSGASLKELDRDGGGEAYTITEVRQVLARNRPQEPAWLAFAIGCYAGLRAAEIRALRWEDIDFTARTIRVGKGKGNKVRTVELQAELAEILLPLSGRGEKVVKTGPVVRLAEPRLHTQHHLDPLLDDAGVVRDRGRNEVSGLKRMLGWHSCRRTYAAASLGAGVDDLALARNLGHTVNEKALTGAYAGAFVGMKAQIQDEGWPAGRLCFRAAPNGKAEAK